MRTAIILVLVFVSATVQAQDSQLSASEKAARFQLYSDCAPVYLLVEDLPPVATNMGLTENAILTTTRSRLRGARIYSSNEFNMPYLYVNINVFGYAFNITIELKKFVSDLATDIVYPATTWASGSTGTHGQDPGFILQSLGQHIDRFIDEYLAVNESDCE